MEKADFHSWKDEVETFRKKTEDFYAGELDKGAYKAFSGRYGSYAQRSGEHSMLRLRMPCGRITMERLSFLADIIERYHVTRAHFTTCQTVQLHDLDGAQTADIMAEALEAGIITLGCGGDYPRNVMCSPLAGVEREEYFDILPWAEAAGDYLLRFIYASAMPRKLKVAFSGSPANLTHATYRDLGFVARPDGNFDVYSAGGLGSNPRMGICVAKAVDPSQILYHIRAMWLLFCSYGNYEVRSRARTRYIPEALGGPEAYIAAWQEKLKEALESEEDLTLHLTPKPVTKTGDGVHEENFRVLAQKQEGLYTVLYHPIGGQPPVSWFSEIRQVLRGMRDVELRLAPDESAYVINLTAREADRVLKATEGGARTPFEASVSCIGGSTCQVGMGDSQRLLASCIDAVRKAGLPDHALPQIHISGCPSSCGTQQTGVIGFNGTVRLVEGKPVPAFFLHLGGRERQGEVRFGALAGALAEKDIPHWLVSLGRTVAESGLDYMQWSEKNPDGALQLAKPWLI